MKQSDDIVNLFQQFGSKADPYQELARKQEHQRSSERWPLVSAVRGALGADVPAVERNQGGLPAATPQNPTAAAVNQSATAGWAQRAEPMPSEPDAPIWAPAKEPQTAAAPAPVMFHAQAAAPRVPPVTAPPLTARSPLAGLAGLHASATAALRDSPASPQEPLPTDLPSVFARLAGSVPPKPAAPWQPRKGQP